MTLGASLVACGPAPAPVAIAIPASLFAPFPSLDPRPRSDRADRADRADLADPSPDPACAADADCGYDPASSRCVASPRANRQPPLLDQGLVCYCAASRCETLRALPIPCESDASCAVRADPRPHPVAASAAHPHERGRACRDFTIATTCERTNICTMTHLRCPAVAR